MRTQTTWAWIIGAVFVLIGLIGFVNDPILNLFNVNGLHNIVHLASGALFLVAAWQDFARPVNRWFGIFYFLLGILGFFIPLTFLDMSAGADPNNFLHISLGGISALIGWLAD